MIGTAAVGHLIREDKIAQIYSAMQAGGSVGMQTLDQCLTALVEQGLISAEIAREQAQFPKDF